MKLSSFSPSPALLAGSLMILGACGGKSHPGRVDGGSDSSDGDLEDELDGGLSRDDAQVGADGEVLPGRDTDAALPFPTNDAGQVLCGTGLCACNDGMDNDSDGVTDLADPECVSAWDDDEASFATGISGDNRDGACQDCFFDGNSGSGNDGCYLPSQCLIDGTPGKAKGICSSCEQTADCKSFCQAYTPNGCDCFGCCDVRVGGQVKHLMIKDGCQIDGDTTQGCTECVPSTTCVNTCGECELCPGKTVSDLPPSCSASPDAGVPDYVCEDGAQRCGDGMPACSAAESCSFGCCVLTPVVVIK